MSFKLITTQTIPTFHGPIYKLLNEEIAPKFGELYVTPVSPLEVKGWKCHTETDLFLFPIRGSVIFYILELHPNASKCKPTRISLQPPLHDTSLISEFTVLSIKKNTWFSFIGGESSIVSSLMSFSTLLHNSAECINFPFDSSHL